MKSSRHLPSRSARELDEFGRAHLWETFGADLAGGDSVQAFPPDGEDLNIDDPHQRLPTAAAHHLAAQGQPVPGPQHVPDHPAGDRFTAGAYLGFGW
jgi:hypothetical protein